MKPVKEIKSSWLANWHKPATAFKWSLLFLLVTAVLGTLLRYFFVAPIAWAAYKHLLHAHSHIAFLGWVYNALFALIVHYFIAPPAKRKLMKLFWFTQTATLGMLIFFPLQGYGRESILFSSLHLLFSWMFAILSWQNLHSQSTTAKKCLRLSLVFMIISGLGPLALGPLMANGLGGSNWYHTAIYYYLHFQYNGWFIFALLALLFQILQQKGIMIRPASAEKAYKLLGTGCVLSLSLSIVWAAAADLLYLLAALGGLLQLIGFYYLCSTLGAAISYIREFFMPLAKHLLLLVVLAFLLKLILQLGAAFPLLAPHAFGNRNVIIAFLHLVFLGVATPAILACGFQLGWLPLRRPTTVSTYGAFGAFAGSQLLLLWPFIPGLPLLPGPLYAPGMLLLSGLLLFFLSGILLPAFVAVHAPCAIKQTQISSLKTAPDAP